MFHSRTYLDNDVLVTHEMRHRGRLNRGHLLEAHRRDGVQDPLCKRRREGIPSPRVALGGGNFAWRHRDVGCWKMRPNALGGSD